MWRQSDKAMPWLRAGRPAVRGGRRRRSAGPRGPELVAAGVLALLLSIASEARADAPVQQRASRLDYALELEPHALLSIADPRREYSSVAWGLGLRLSVPVADHGFIPTANDSVAFGFGVGWVRYEAESCPGMWAPTCTRTVPGVTPPDGAAGGAVPICVETGGVVLGSSMDAHYFYLPIALQYDFWLPNRLSLFLEAGVIPFVADPSEGAERIGVHPSFALGLRGRFSKRTTLTLRLGYPTLSLGLSFLPPKRSRERPRPPPAAR